MLERFTERARQALVLAEGEAVRRGDSEVGAEALLLGLYRERGGVAGAVLAAAEWTPQELDGTAALASIGIDFNEVRDAVEESFGEGALQAAMAATAYSTRRLPFAPGSKQVIQAALGEARAPGHNYIGTEHLLLALADHVRIPDLRQKVLAELAARISARP